MGSNPNTLDIQAVWSAEYQIAHFRQPVFRAFATERLSNILKYGDTVHRTWRSDFVVNSLGGDGSYASQGLTDTDETLVVNVKKEVTFTIPEWNKLQSQLPVARDYARKAANSLWLETDADLLNNMYSNAQTIVDDGSIGGVAGNPLVISSGNVLQVFGACLQALQKQNIAYVPKQYTGDVKKDGTDLMPVCAISPEVYFAMLQFVAGKNSAKGDEMTMDAYMGYFYGFNVMVSNNLTAEVRLAMPNIPTALDSFTLFNGVTIAGTSQALTFNFQTTPAAAGDLVVANTAANGATNVKNALNAPYTLITNSSSAGYFNFTQSNLTIQQQLMLSNLTASIVGTTTVKIVVEGCSNIPVSATFTNANNKWSRQVQHNVFGTSRSIDLIMQKTPNLSIRPVSGKVAYDYVTWNLYGYKVFNDQKYQLIDLQIDTTNFTQAPTITAQ